MHEMLFKGGLDKAFTASYDDGLITDERLKNIFDANAIKCTFNINYSLMQPCGAALPEKITKENMWTRARLNDYVALMKDSGHEIAIHGFTHSDPAKFDDDEAFEEYSKDKKALEETFGTVIRGCAYAFGNFNEASKKALKKLGIHYSRTVKSTFSFDIPEHRITLDPTCHHNENILELGKKFLSDNERKAKLFYLWGHSCELEVDGKWSEMEEFARLIGRRGDVWYATNIEIFDYIDAYNALEFSENEKFVYNPSALDVWLDIGGETWIARAGKITKL